ncbi:hypothetical protein [Cupriavidus sp. a3]|uniref:hypothetical protein n=1 Tax=Cupriavidus sp. a3 TaxID=3242158 RepID=UPI003D9C1890
MAPFLTGSGIFGAIPPSRLPQALSGCRAAPAAKPLELTRTEILLEAFCRAGFAETISDIGNFAILACASAAGCRIEDAGRLGLYNKRAQFLTAKCNGQSVILAAH